jgi:hypothetical protein
MYHTIPTSDRWASPHSAIYSIRARAVGGDAGSVAACWSARKRRWDLREIVSKIPDSLQAEQQILHQHRRIFQMAARAHADRGSSSRRRAGKLNRSHLNSTSWLTPEEVSSNSSTTPRHHGCVEVAGDDSPRKTR